MFKTLEKLVAKTTIRTAGRLVTYHYLPEAQDATIKGVFDNANVEIHGVSTTNPLITFYEGDLLRTPSTLDKITIESALYKIIDIRSDGVSGVVLILQED